MQKYLTLRGGSAQTKLRMLGYYVQRAVTSRTVRRAATQATIAVLGSLHGRSERRRQPGSQALREHGHAALGRLLSAQQCAEAVAWLNQRDLIAVRGGGHAFRPDAVPPGTRMGDFPLATVVDCPHVMQTANHPDVLRLATDYLGYTPTITLMGLRWSFPADADGDADVQHFHRDSEPGSIKLLMYLTDVDAGSGPHNYVPGTHRDRMPLRLRRYSDAEVARAHGASIEITGPAGTAFVIDTKGIHKGAPPLSRPRLVLVVQYSLLPCLVYDYVPQAYHGGGLFDAYVNRLMIKPAFSDAPAAVLVEE